MGVTTLEIEIAVADYFGIRQNLIIPNVSWALGLHECDLLVITKSGYAYEIEVKVSKADLMRDLKKRHSHQSSKIKKLYFAIPKSLDTDKIKSYIPETAGVLVLQENGSIWKIKEAVNRKTALKITDSERVHIYHLCAMRLWTMKRRALAWLKR